MPLNIMIKVILFENNEVFDLSVEKKDNDLICNYRVFIVKRNLIAK